MSSQFEAQRWHHRTFEELATKKFRCMHLLANDEETDYHNYGMVQYVKWENGFVGIDKEFIVEIQESTTQTQ